MEAKSPMLLHSIESFQHGIEHYLDGTPRSRKFAVLHVDHAIELAIKEKVVLLGKGVYKQDGQTFSIHEAINSLEKSGINIIEKPRIQEIHDLRNTIQHKGLTPDEFTTQFYIDCAYSFFKRFVIEELNIDFKTILPQKYINMLEGKPEIEIPDIREDLKATAKIESKVERVVRAHTILEHVAAAVHDPLNGITGFRKALRYLGETRGQSKEKLDYLMDSIQKLRGQVVHSDYVPDEEEVQRFMNHVGQLLRLVGAFEKKG